MLGKNKNKTKKTTYFHYSLKIEKTWLTLSIQTYVAFAFLISIKSILNAKD